jgi:hypothetical protein
VQVILYVLMGVIRGPMERTDERNQAFRVLPSTEGMLLHAFETNPTPPDASAARGTGGNLPNPHGPPPMQSTNECKHEVITPSWVEIQQLMMARNSLAMSLRAPPQNATPAPTAASFAATFSHSSASSSAVPAIPPMLHHAHTCSRCFQQTECMLLHAAVEGGTEASSGVPDVFKQLTLGLSPVHQSYIRHWHQLLTLEYSAQVHRAVTHRLWSVPSSLREKNGDPCLSSLVVRLEAAPASGNGSQVTESAHSGHQKILRICQYEQLTTARSAAQNANSASDLLERCRHSSLFVGDRVIVSIERFNRATGVQGSSAGTGSGGGALDMEDLVQDTTTPTTDPNVAAGVITSIAADGILVACGTTNSRLLRYFSGSDYF